MKRFLPAVLILLSLLVLTGCEDTSIADQLEKAREMSGWMVGLTLALSTLISEDLACVIGGILAGEGHTTYFIATMGCFLGIYIEDMLLYWAGRAGGMGLLRRAPLKWMISEKKVRKGEEMFEQHGAKLIFTSRFVPGSRLPLYVSAGIFEYPAWKFALYMFIACGVWTPILVAFSMKVGEKLMGWLEIYEKYAWKGLIGGVIMVYLLVKLIEALWTYRGRRLLEAKFLRIREWEFWPKWVFYPPVLLRILFLAIRYRSLTVFTLASRGIKPYGGLAYASKHAVLNSFPKDHRIARFQLIWEGDVEERMAELGLFQRETGAEYPVVLKPDAGDRGKNVVVARSEAEAREQMTSYELPLVAQEYIEGVEFGLFYVRHPEWESGRIISITEKKLPYVIGDGKRTLARLIFDDPRSLRMAGFLMKKWEAKLDDVPEYGVRFMLGDLGTHSRGATFLDAYALKTPKLEATIDDISRQFEGGGFHFGRYDLRVPSAESLQAGKGIRVLELNGVSSESTHIYSPGRSIWLAYRELFKQWDLAFEIGDAIRERDGVEPPTFKEVASFLWARRKQKWEEIRGAIGIDRHSRK